MAEQTSDIGEQLATIERKPAKERAPDYSRLQATVGKELGAAETGLKKAEIDVGIAQKEAGTKALREQIGLEEKELEAGRERVSRYELPTFTPSQETLTDYARLGSMVMTLGLMLGKGAKDSGLTALNAMSGLLQGWKQGRKDVYERELKKFDKEFQRIKEIRNSIEKDIQRAIQLWPTKRQEAIAAAESAAYKAGSGSIIEYYAKTGQLKKAQELIASSKKTTDEIVKQQARIDEINAREKAANDRAARKIAATIEAAKIRTSAAGGKASQQMFIAQRAVTALRGAASTMESVTQLPATATAGFLPFLSNKEGMMNYVKNAGGRKLSAQESKAIETLYSGMSRYLATIEASGTAVGLVGLASQLEKIQPKAGDTIADVALKIADTRRIATEAVSAMIESGLLPEQQAKAAEEQIKRFEKAVPFTTSDVVKAQFGGKRTLGEATAEAASPRAGGAGWSNADEARLRELEEKARGPQ